LFDRQTKWDSAESEDAAKKIFRGYAKDIGLDLTAYESCLTDSSITDAIQEDMDEGVALGVDSTPTFFVNNRRVDTSNGVEEGLRSAIDAELQAVGDNQSSAPTSSTNQPDVTNDNTAQ
jgi:protein-disulfide isomerase